MAPTTTKCARMAESMASRSHHLCPNGESGGAVVGRSSLCVGPVSPICAYIRRVHTLSVSPTPPAAGDTHVSVVTMRLDLDSGGGPHRLLRLGRRCAELVVMAAGSGSICMTRTTCLRGNGGSDGRSLRSRSSARSADLRDYNPRSWIARIRRVTRVRLDDDDVHRVARNLRARL